LITKADIFIGILLIAVIYEVKDNLSLSLTILLGMAFFYWYSSKVTLEV